MVAAHHEVAVRSAIAGAIEDGIVNPNIVRSLIPDWVPAKTVGVIYQKLRRDGTLVEFDHIRSNDVRGRNSGKLVPRYKVARPVVLAVKPEPKPAPKPKPQTQPSIDLGPCANCRAETVRYGDHGHPLCEWCR
jgi:hypothetical protein